MEARFSKLLQESLAGKNPEGCTAEEIAELEMTYDVRFPQDYREFLTYVGRGADSLWVGSDYTWSWFPIMQEAGVERFADVGLEWPKGAFVFLMHQGYQFFYLTVDGVYYYYEGRNAPEKEHNSFAEFFEVSKTRW